MSILIGFTDTYNISPGSLFSAADIDREEMAGHSFHVTATDGSGLDSTVIYSISVTDENDNAPEFTTGNSYSLTLDEDQNLNQVHNVLIEQN